MTVKKYFAYNSEDGFELFETMEEAALSAQTRINLDRSDASNDGWPDEEEMDSICIGIVTHKATKINERTWTEEYETEEFDEDLTHPFDFVCDYELQKIE